MKGEKSQNLKIMQTKEKLKSYTNIKEAIEDYVKEIKNNFKPCVVIRTHKKEDYTNELQTTIYNKAKEEFKKIGKNIFLNNGEEIYVSNSDIKESVAKIVRSDYQKQLLTEHLELFSKLDKIIENGKLVTSACETKNRWQNQKWDYYITPIKINGQKYIVEFDTAIKSEDNKKHFRIQRIFKLQDIKKQTVPTGMVE